jgi:hypothetical protein
MNGDDLLSLLSVILIEVASRNVQENGAGLDLKAICKLRVLAGDNNLLVKK